MLMRPDPHTISRRPMASTDAKVVITRPKRADGHAGSVFEAGRLNLDTLHTFLEVAEVAAEGRVDPILEPTRFFGSWTLSLMVTEVSDENESVTRAAEKLGEAFRNDARAWRVIEDKTYRELSRLLGVDTSVEFECQVQTVPDGSTVRIVVDFECPVKVIGNPVRAMT